MGKECSLLVLPLLQRYRVRFSEQTAKRTTANVCLFLRRTPGGNPTN